MAGSYAAALLDELMGRNRDANPNDKRRDMHWSDTEVCIISSLAYYRIDFTRNLPLIVLPILTMRVRQRLT